MKIRDGKKTVQLKKHITTHSTKSNCPAARRGWSCGTVVSVCPLFFLQGLQGVPSQWSRGCVEPFWLFAPLADEELAANYT